MRIVRNKKSLGSGTEAIQKEKKKKKLKDKNQLRIFLESIDLVTLKESLTFNILKAN